MKAIRLKGFGGIENLKLEEVEIPKISFDEVLVRVKACGVCYHDLLNRSGKIPRTRLPIILGHEIAGEVVEVGSHVKDFSPGDRVTAIQRVLCGSCTYCRTGRESLCREGPGFLGEEIDGGYAEYIKIKMSSLCKIPNEISFEEASILACAIGTSLHAFKTRAKISLGDQVVITGAGGGVGLHAVQVAKLCGGRVLAITSSKEKIDKIWEAGADEVIYSPDLQFTKEVKALTKGRGADIVVEIVGSASFESSLRCLAPSGKLVFLGNVITAPVLVNPGLVILKEIELIGSYAVTREELVEVIDLVRQRKIRSIVSHTLPLEKASEAHQLLQDRKTVGRLVLSI
ncbi:MAG TPA: alcohol dehydrogenase catalytic domain-containing protein [Candidatus Limnocylindrales bacterium]|nr:alcohol dehydrogenase catalytic domain-containing protein [Candidatus Limnocylindrales bacterium]